MKYRSFLLKANAKINIGLRVLSKRPDGFHNLETIFYPIALSDDIKMSFSQIKRLTNIIVKTIPEGIIPPDQNICKKAISLFLEEFGITDQFKISVTIKKNIPSGAGLGGGSSDAAQVLKVMYKFFKNRISIRNAGNKISKIALILGSDVPFFIDNSPAYATSRGEKLVPLRKFKIKSRILIVNPGINIRTSWAFKELRMGKKKRSPQLKKIINKLNNRNLLKTLKTNPEIFENDFEKIVLRKYPEIEKIKENMMAYGATFASLSGSGSSVYGIFEKNPDEAKKFLTSSGYFTYVC